MACFVKLREAINTPLLNVNPENRALQSQILALKSYYVVGNLNISRIDLQNLTLFLTFISHCFIRPYLPQSAITLIFEALLLALPCVQPDYKCIPSFAILMLSCLIHPVFEFVMDLCLIFSFLINILLTLRRSASHRSYFRWELLVMTHLLCVSGIEGLFDTLVLLASWCIFLQPDHRRLDDAFFITFILLQVAGELLGCKSSM